MFFYSLKHTEYQKKKTYQFNSSMNKSKKSVGISMILLTHFLLKKVRGFNCRGLRSTSVLMVAGFNPR